MRTRIVKKNNPELLKRRGRGFRGRVLAVQFGDRFAELNGINKRPREEAMLRYCELDLSDVEIFKLQQIFLKKYGKELLTLKSYNDFCGAKQDGKLFARELNPVNNQSQLELA